VGSPLIPLLQPVALDLADCLRHAMAAQLLCVPAKFKRIQVVRWCFEHEGQLVGYVSGYCDSTFDAGGQQPGSMNCSRANASVVQESVDNSWTPLSSGQKEQHSVLVALATRGAAAFFEHRGYTSKAAYYKKYFAPASFSFSS